MIKDIKDTITCVLCKKENVEVPVFRKPFVDDLCDDCWILMKTRNLKFLEMLKERMKERYPSEVW